MYIGREETLSELVGGSLVAYNEESVGRVISTMSAIAIATYLLINSHLQSNLVLGFAVSIRLAIMTVDRQNVLGGRGSGLFSDGRFGQETIPSDMTPLIAWVIFCSSVTQI